MKKTEFATLLPPATLVIFGITGDLAHRKLLPSLYHLAKHDMLPPEFRVVGVTRRGIALADLLKNVRQSLKDSGHDCDERALLKLKGLLEIFTMDLMDPADYKRLGKRLDAIEDEATVCMNRLFYLAIPAQTFAPVVAKLGTGGLNKSCQHSTGDARLLIEKPFGYDLTSAQELITELSHSFNERQIYRIDHYLAKETAQNILDFRFQNPIFKHVWANHAISHISITAAETIDIEGRTTFYEQTGALRDFLQSHLLQLLALVTMEEPDSLTASGIHREKLTLLEHVAIIAPNKVAQQTVRGQYEGYRREVDNPDSATETFAAVRLYIENARWRGVPVLLRTGKALAEKTVEIVMTFADKQDDQRKNMLVIHIQPGEGISLQLLAKKPGFTNEVEPVQMDFCYSSAFPGENGHPDAYERVLMDAFRGDKTLFATKEEVLASWRILDNVVQEWAKNDTGLVIYPKDSWGPEETEKLAQAAGTTWQTNLRNIC
ncbi:MAG TPA: glucose-6-phosphate dehydrogenase [Candidatus Saccharimonadales bacterium]|nr:glucose-6-phosphate dehydrogenase [Candidatus Saccharimonadales bacterium]